MLIIFLKAFDIVFDNNLLNLHIQLAQKFQWHF